MSYGFKRQTNGPSKSYLGLNWPMSPIWVHLFLKGMVLQYRLLLETISTGFHFFLYEGQFYWMYPCQSRTVILWFCNRPRHLIILLFNCHTSGPGVLMDGILMGRSRHVITDSEKQKVSLNLACLWFIFCFSMALNGKQINNLQENIEQG